MSENVPAVKDPAGDRMKRYEAATKGVLPRRTYTVVRVDGRAFHSYLKGAERPYDHDFMNAMDAVTLTLLEEISGSVCAFTQSDEISVLAQDFRDLDTEPWFGGQVQKIASVSAALAAAHLDRILRSNFDVKFPAVPAFDSRVFTIPEPVEVANYFRWRQRDAMRNAVTMIAQAMYSESELHGKSTAERVRMINKGGYHLKDFNKGFRRGRLFYRQTHKNAAGETTSTRWVILPSPILKARPGTLLASLIPPLPSFTGDSE